MPFVHSPLPHTPIFIPIQTKGSRSEAKIWNGPYFSSPTHIPGAQVALLLPFSTLHEAIHITHSVSIFQSQVMRITRLLQCVLWIHNPALAKFLIPSASSMIVPLTRGSSWGHCSPAAISWGRDIFPSFFQAMGLDLEWVSSLPQIQPPNHSPSSLAKSPQFLLSCHHPISLATSTHCYNPLLDCSYLSLGCFSSRLTVALSYTTFLSILGDFTTHRDNGAPNKLSS